MKEIMWHFPAGDFSKLRVACHHKDCSFVFELPLSKVEAAMEKANGSCPLCSRPFTNLNVHGGADMVSSLAKALLALDKLRANVGVQFPVKEAKQTGEPETFGNI